MRHRRLLAVLAVLAIAFGALTVLSGGRVLFGGTEARAAAGQVVDFVLWFNFLAGFAYVAVGLELWRRRRWAVRGAALLALLTAIIAALFGLHVLSGGAYEMRTVGALALRLSFWSALALVARRAAQSTTG
ncbi:hypothetical protein [Denitromonas ohlonensis]|jgi:hypothetical protein|uniref:DUF4345 domain-containing protein n=2 Tax=Denitromonas TaxID=139331 RepID=A0A557SBF7_9RHOO|nr:hypothetical protein [Denitromonas ohlonensis]TVO68353.1 hypothetical protein FHP90_03465 [Denitromonas ohlonensis]TVO74631.1 hypothetical protein FHP89_15015 [Denitromonas ohlonensis]TVT51029.1 MAG: hypothetical protein FHP94_01590 [Denitromonas halophila]TVT67236.1 MAG: hypothetical protein FHP93_17785 [Denitromonas halophila]